MLYSQVLAHNLKQNIFLFCIHGGNLLFILLLEHAKNLPQKKNKTARKNYWWCNILNLRILTDDFIFIPFFFCIFVYKLYISIYISINVVLSYIHIYICCVMIFANVKTLCVYSRVPYRRIIFANFFSFNSIFDVVSPCALS